MAALSASIELTAGHRLSRGQAVLTLCSLQCYGPTFKSHVMEEDEIWQLRTEITSIDPTHGAGVFPHNGAGESSPLRLNARSDEEEQRNLQSTVRMDPNACSSSHRIPSYVQAYFRSVISSVLIVKRSVSSTPKHELRCTVILLDGQRVTYYLELFIFRQTGAFGHELFDLVATHLELEERGYFGLVYFIDSRRDSCHESAEDAASVLGDVSSSRTDEQCSHPTISSMDYRRSLRKSGSIRRGTMCFKEWNESPEFVGDVPFWLRMDRRIADQCKGSDLMFYFQVKYFIPHPECDIGCPNARHQYCLQLCDNLTNGRLPCSFYTHVILGAYIAQMTFGNARMQRSLDDDESLRTSGPDSKRQSMTVCSSLGTHSLLSERTCSLAEPEQSDDSVVWNPRDEAQPLAAVTRAKCATIGTTSANHPLATIGPDCSRSVRSDSVQLTYLSILPHLDWNKTCPASIQHRNTMDFSRGTMESTSLSDRIGPSAGPNWPYPKMIALSCPQLLSRVARFHRRLHGMSRSNAECAFLNCARRMALYGVELHTLKDLRIQTCHSWASRHLSLIVRSLHNFRGHARAASSSANHIAGDVNLAHSGDDQSNQSSVSPILRNPTPPDYTCGVHSSGILIYRGRVRMAIFPWSRIVKISLHRSIFRLVARNCEDDSGRGQKILYNFIFSSPKLAARFYRSCIDHHRYFRLRRSRANDVGGPAALPCHTRELRQTSDTAQRRHSMPRRRTVPLERNSMRNSCNGSTHEQPAVVVNRRRGLSLLQRIFSYRANPNSVGVRLGTHNIPTHPAIGISTTDREPSPLMTRNENSTPRTVATVQRIPRDDLGSIRDHVHTPVLCSPILSPVYSVGSTESNGPTREPTTTDVEVHRNHSADSEIGIRRAGRGNETSHSLSLLVSETGASEQPTFHIYPSVCCPTIPPATLPAVSPVCDTPCPIHAQSDAPVDVRVTESGDSTKSRSATPIRRPPRPSVPPLICHSKRFTLPKTNWTVGSDESLSEAARQPQMVSASGSNFPNHPCAWSVAIVPTYTSLITPDGTIHRLLPSQCATKPVSPPPLLLSSRTQNEASGPSGFSSSPNESATGNASIQTTPPLVIPVVRTKSFRYPIADVQFNQYTTLASSTIIAVNGLAVPVIPTKSLYLRHQNIAYRFL
ncbi:unnamed protein product [Calicophoron daubneyi]|uniref:FERM domain-containing protein n=1 Tax=Calicophoron daubneyi TaxID=300641 RepID=A0AAV2TMM2_CALDB